MEYKKPEVVALANAICVIQSMGKLHGTVDNGDPKSQFPSIPAYEADE